jgi:hypothetical protein
MQNGCAFRGLPIGGPGVRWVTSGAVAGLLGSQELAPFS